MLPQYVLLIVQLMLGKQNQSFSATKIEKTQNRTEEQ